jgi:hypothetical protein
MPILTEQFYRLNGLLDASAIPGNFKALEDLAQNVIDTLLGKIYYKDLIVRRYGDGERRYYSIVLLSKRLEIPIFNIGFNLVFFDGTTTNFSEFPIGMNWNWPVYRYIAGFGQQGFEYTPQAFIGLLMELADIESEEEVISEIIDVFLSGGNNDYQTFFTDLIAKANSYNIVGLAPGASSQIQMIVSQLQTIETEVTAVLTSSDLFTLKSLFEGYQNHTGINNAVNTIKTALDVLEDTYEMIPNIVGDLVEVIIQGFSDLDEKLEHLVALFETWLGNIESQDVYDLLIPQFDIELSGINVALEFPRNWLIPMIEQPTGSGKYVEHPDPNAQTGLRFTVGRAVVSSKYGFQFKNESLIDLERCQIGQTGLMLEINNVQLDLSEGGNTLPGTNRYPTNFKGVYIDELIIALPSFWNKNTTATADIFADDVLIGGYKDDNGDHQFIFNGTVGLRDPLGPGGPGALATTLPGGLGLELDEFSLTFFENQITQSLVKGELTIPFKESGTNQNKKVGLEGLFNDNGFSLSVTDNSGNLFSVDLGAFATLTIHYVTIGSENGKFFFSLKTSLQLNIEFPLLDKFIPNPIVLEELKVSENGIEKFDINLSWNSADEVDMSSVLGDVSVVLPIDLNIFDIIEIYTLKIGISDAGNGKVSLKTLVDGRLSIGNKGPVVATVGDIGMETLISYKSDNTGNLGPLDLEFKFVPPTKIGLSIDAKAVTGGGAVWFDFDNERYVGALELTVKNTIGIVVVGIMSFKRPDGTKGFSLLLLVSVEFATVQLGMGFVLTGVGGLLGINRGMNPDVLRDGIRTGLLDHILFPSDPVANIDAIVTGLESAFPQRQHQFIIGPMLQMGWGGAKSLVKLEIGLLIELFNPVKIAIPGVLSIELPDEEAAVVAIFVNFIGIIDFQEKFASFDASLFGSHILQEITLSGDMAFRLKWGDEPDFLFSMGGFHPEYTPPPLKLPNMARIGVSLLNLDNAQVGFELYFAVTTNSVQAGAAVFAEFRAGEFAVVGRFSFDVLFEFNPFRMVISAELQAALEFGGFPILKIVAGVRLSGPTPWNVSGTASIAIIGIEFSIDFDHTFGENLDTTVPNIALMPLVRAELEKGESWRSDFPSGGKSMVQFRSVEGAEKVAAHPSGRFIVEQTIVPLNIQMDKYGQNGIADSNEYSITKVSAVSAGLPSEELLTSSISNLFAPDQHFELTDEEKIKGPSFERFASGVVIDKTDRLLVSRAVSKDVAYEQLLVQSSLQNSWETQEEGSTEIDDKTIFEDLSRGGAVGDSPLSSNNQALREDIVWSKSTSHYIVNNITMQPFVSSSHLATVRTLGKSEAERLLGQILEAEPQLEDLLMIVEEHELDNNLLAQPANKTAVLAL